MKIDSGIWKTVVVHAYCLNETPTPSEQPFSSHRFQFILKQPLGFLNFPVGNTPRPVKMLN